MTKHRSKKKKEREAYLVAGVDRAEAEADCEGLFEILQRDARVENRADNTRGSSCLSFPPLVIFLSLTKCKLTRSRRGHKFYLLGRIFARLSRR